MQFLYDPVDFPYSNTEVETLIVMAQSLNAVVSKYYMFSEFNLTEIRKHQQYNSVEHRAHFDTNFFIAFKSLFDSSKRDHANSKEISALIALFIYSDLQFNPTLAVYETAMNTPTDPNKDLTVFRYANNLHPKIYANYALGKTISLPQPSEADLSFFNKRSESDLRTYPKYFEVNFISLLGLMFIHTSPHTKNLNGKDKLLAYMEWMYTEFLYIHLAILCAYTLWGRRVNVKSIIKKSGTKDFETLVKNLKNASYDLALITNYTKWEYSEPRESDHLNLILTLDKSLALISDEIFTMKNGDVDVKSFKKYTRTFFDEVSTDEILAKYTELNSKCKGRQTPNINRDTFIESLELRIKNNLKTS